MRRRVSADDAEDILQDVYADLVEVTGALTPIDELGAWLYRDHADRAAEDRCGRLARAVSATVRIAAIGSAQSGRTPSSKAALPPIIDHANGMTRSVQGAPWRANKNTPKVKMTSGQGVTPNMGMASQACPFSTKSNG